jgi:hypothetical protein
MSETHIVISLSGMYIPQNREFGTALSKLRNFGRGFEPPLPLPPSPVCHRVFIDYARNRIQISSGCEY